MKLAIFTGFLFMLAGLFIGGLVQACKRPMPPHTTDFKDTDYEKYQEDK